MKILVLAALILAFSRVASAAVTVSPGVAVTNAHGSEEKSDENGRELATFESAVGITLEAEWSFLKDSVGVVAGVLWRGSQAETQYNYTNPDNPLDTAQVEDLKANSSSFSAFFGPRFRFLNLKYFKLFAGAGWTPGILYLNYNENKFLAANGSAIGFKEKEHRNFQGTYFETGLELHSKHGGSIRLLGRMAETRTERFETLGDKKLNLRSGYLSLQYVHLF